MLYTAGVSTRPHVVYVAWGFPPFRGGGAYRTLATANALVEAGFRVTVLTADRESFERYFSSDSSMEAAISPEVEVVRIPFSWPGRDSDVRMWDLERAKDPKGWREHYLAHYTDDFPEPNFGSWYPALIAAAERVHRENPVDLVIGSANPNVDFAVGEHLNAKYGVPHVLDHRDAWRLDVYNGGELYADDPRVAEFETRAMNSAQEIWFVNEPIRRWHQRMYPLAADRMHVVENGFETDLRPKAHLAGPAERAPLRFAYVGTIGQRVPMVEMVEGWILARRSCEDLRDARADIWGPITSPVSVAAMVLPDAGPYGVHYRGPVRKAEVPKVYDEADALLLTLSAGAYVTSGKVYEYMATGLPIVSLHEPTNAATEVLRDYPLWVPAAGLAEYEVAEALTRVAALCRYAEPEQRRRAVEFGARFERRVQLRPVADRLLASVTQEAATG